MTIRTRIGESKGEWVTEFICSACGTPTNPGDECSYCLRFTDIKEHREWVCLTHGNACFCSPYVVDVDAEPFA